jgi:hypothetical protein
VKARRLPEIDKVEQEVRARLKKEINYWDSRAFELKEEERAGKKTRLNWQNAQRRAEDLAERLKRRMALLEQERFISSQPPRVRGGMVVIPRGLLEARQPAMVGTAAGGFSEDPVARRQIELAAMAAVIAAERSLGNMPSDVSAQKVGYDVASYDPKIDHLKIDHLRFIEVKGRADGADTVMITRQEVITSLNEPEKFILAIVQVENGLAREPRYVRGALDTREPPFEQNAIQFNIKRLLERGEGAVSSHSTRSFVGQKAFGLTPWPYGAVALLLAPPEPYRACMAGGGISAGHAETDRQKTCHHGWKRVPPTAPPPWRSERSSREGADLDVRCGHGVVLPACGRGIAYGRKLPSLAVGWEQAAIPHSGCSEFDSVLFSLRFLSSQWCRSNPPAFGSGPTRKRGICDSPAACGGRKFVSC